MKRFEAILVAISILFMPIKAQATTVQTTTESEISIETKILYIDAHGDFSMDLTAREFRQAGFSQGDLVRVTLSDKDFDVVVSPLYCLVPAGDLYIYMGDDDENISFEGNMVFAIVKSEIGERDYIDGKTVWSLNSNENIDDVTITLIEKKHDPVIADTPELCRSSDLSDYSSDEVYANFREVRVGSIAPGILYRSCSPIDNYLNRSEAADHLAETVGIKAFLNLSDNEDYLSEMMVTKKNLCPYYCSQAVIADCFVQDFTDPQEMKKLGRVLTDLSEMPTPWLIHCTEGKDRTGFVCLLLEMLLNANRCEIEIDYTKSFINYFHLEDKPELCKAIGTRMVGGMMKQIGNPREYLLDCGMDEETIDILSNRLKGLEVNKTLNT